MEEKLTTELFKELKAYGKRWFVIAIILAVMLFASNIAWLYYWNLPDEATTETYDIDSKDNGNAIYNDSGKVNVNGKDSSTENNGKKK